jgi:hypothetical protein
LQKVTGYLNKISEENYVKISGKILKLLEGSNAMRMRNVSSLVFNKAVMEHSFAALYANLSKDINDKVDAVDDDGKVEFCFLVLMRRRGNVLFIFLLKDVNLPLWKKAKCRI